jgi:hypothetical protein
MQLTRSASGLSALPQDAWRSFLDYLCLEEIVCLDSAVLDRNLRQTYLSALSRIVHYDLSLQVAARSSIDNLEDAIDITATSWRFLSSCWCSIHPGQDSKRKFKVRGPDLQGKMLVILSLFDMELLTGGWMVVVSIVPKKGQPRCLLHLFSTVGGKCRRNARRK